MDKKEKIMKEIARLNELIKDNEKIMDQIPEYMRANQEFALNICKRQLATLELELAKLEEANSKNKRTYIS